MTGIRTIGTTPRDYGIRLALCWSAALAAGRPLAMSRTAGARAGDVWATDNDGVKRDDIDAALMWLASRGVIAELVEVDSATNPQRYRLSLTLGRLDAWLTRETAPRVARGAA